MMTGNDRSALSGLKVLVVEDSYFVAIALSKQLKELGCTIIGPAPSVAAALSLLKTEPCDAAVLDINLGSETAEPVADALVEQKTPFLFVTGYSSPRLLAKTYSTHRRLVKPVTPEMLRDALAAVLNG
ncbi:MAG: response regulator [Phycisphaerae bacterium]|nr:response regulator [Phycisphaerae bacterium]